MKRKYWVGLLFVAGVTSSVAGPSQLLAVESYEKSTEGAELVKNKLYAKDKSVELSGNVGSILNQSYVNTFLISFGLNYYFSEEWGGSLDISLGANKDKEERQCIENFYNDPNDEVPAPCGPANNLGGKANFGPAYVPIREIQNIISVNGVWNPVYGKQLILLSTTSYFDLFIEGGLGIATSKFYEKKEVLNNGRVSRGTFEENGDQPNPPLGADVGDTGSYGEAGRPEAQDQTNVLVNLGLGQKFHFAKSFHLKMYIRNMTLLGTPSGFDNLFALYAGAGIRF